MNKTIIPRLFLSASLLFISANLLKAQDLNKIFDDFKKQSEATFEDFKNKADEEFAAFLRETWQKFEGEAPIPPPVRPEPPKPVVFEEDKEKPKPEPIQVKPKMPDITDVPVVPEVKPFVPVKIEKPDIPVGKKIPRTSIPFYGTTIDIATNAVKDLALKGISESNVADAWTKVCKADYEQMVYDCTEARKNHKLNDWAYMLLTKQIGTELYGSNRKEEIAFLQMFLLNKSGYKVRLSKVNDNLMLLITSSETLYGRPYVTLGKERYYIFEPLTTKGGLGIYTYRQDFADAKNKIRLVIEEIPELEMEEYTRGFTSKAAKLTLNPVINKNLVDFYKDYPQCDVAIYYKTPMSQELKESIYPTLQAAIAGKSQRDAANLLIAFVQTGFDYMTDGEQFAYEKPFFFEENFFYPYNDCEDRAMLFSTLVKDLLKLDAILLDYPNHIASAVCFDENIDGDYIILDNKKYIICDPTYIGAPIGLCMDEYKQVQPEIIR